MNKLYLILLTLAFSTIFLLTPTTEPIDFFPFSDQMLTFEMWLYFLFERLIVVILALVILLDSTEFKNSLTVFLWIEIMDTVFYLLFYDDPFMLVLPWNSVKLGIFIFSIGLEKWMQSTNESVS
jgi:hypothetical protein